MPVGADNNDDNWSRASDGDVLRWIRSRVGEFVGHMRDRHDGDARVEPLLGRLRAVALLPADEAAPRASGNRRGGKFNYSSGTLFVTARTPDGKPRSRASLSKTVLHELAHSSRVKGPGEDGHGPAWRENYLFFLEVATKELGWRVDMVCSDCSFYNVCKPDCPKCTWVQRLCKPYVGPPTT